MTGRCAWWDDSALAARSGAEEVIACLGPELGADPASLVRQRERAAPWLGRRTGSVLPLLDVAVVNGRVAWVYEPPEGASAGALLRAEAQGLPMRVAVELCSRVARVLDGLGAEAHGHPGPELDHLLVGPDGQVRVSHFVGPTSRSPARREPRGREDAMAVVWRLGVLLAELLTGQPPQACTDPSSHEASTRRLAIRLLSRPGPPVPDAVRAWVQALMAFEPVERPLLLRVGPGLEELAAQLPLPDLGSWAAHRVPALRHRPAVPVNPDPTVSTEVPLDLRTDDGRADHTEEVVLSDELLERDDETAVSAHGETPTHRSRSEHGAIPVGVGPPVEVVRRIPSLPSALFAEASLSSTHPRPPAPARFGLLVGATLAMTGIGTLLVLYLLW